MNQTRAADPQPAVIVTTPRRSHLTPWQRERMEAPIEDASIASDDCLHGEPAWQSVLAVMMLPLAAVVMWVVLGLLEPLK